MADSREAALLEHKALLDSDAAVQIVKNLAIVRHVPRSCILGIRVCGRCKVQKCMTHFANYLLWPCRDMAADDLPAAADFKNNKPVYLVLYGETLTSNVADRKRLYDLAVHHRIQLVGKHGANIASGIAELATPWNQFPK